MRFQQKVYHLTKKIPWGMVSTYGEIARAMKTRAYRAVGTALNKNPNGFCFCFRRESKFRNQNIGQDYRAGLVPCHRVVLSDGRVGGFAKGTAVKVQLLRKEGISVRNNRIVDFRKKLFRFGKV